MVVRVFGAGTGAKIRRSSGFKERGLLGAAGVKKTGRGENRKNSEGTGKCLAALRPGNRYLCVFWGSS